MDAAARRVRPADLARLAALRARREEEARRAARATAARRAAAEAARVRAEREVFASEAARVAGERAIYDGLARGGAVSVAVLEERRAALGRLAEAVASARAEERARAETEAEAREAQALARAEHGRRARAVDRWDRASGKILAARRALAEQADERETEDETLTRIGAAGARARGVA